MITTELALRHLLDLITPTATEEVPLSEAAGRILASDIAATRAQPPFPASAMDGYALPDPEVQPGRRYRVIGESAAGHGFDGRLGAGSCARIFTGAPLPAGAARVVLQEDVTRDDDAIILGDRIGSGDNIRPAGNDFEHGFTLPAPRRLRPADIALLAAMNCGAVPVRKRPAIALIATGDELVQPGETPGPDQIIASNSYGLAARLGGLGADIRMLPIARDTIASLQFALSLTEGADLVVTIGGASVGDHDLVASAASQMGLERSFYKVAMRPGKPLMAGRLGKVPMIGLPGNPVSAMVCGEIFLQPVIRKFLGLPAGPRPRHSLRLAHPLGANGPREHYMRALRESDGRVRVFERQDSALLSVLADAELLAVRAPNAPEAAENAKVDVLFL